jgi:hypothetical protein
MDNNFNFNIWYESYDPHFTDINRKSFIPEKWLSYQAIDHDKFGELPIKPINRYVEKLYPRPDLVSINDGVVRLRQRNHAEILLLDYDPNHRNSFRNLDRPHMRQYYQTKKDYPEIDICFDQVYLFYTPWILDENLDVIFEQAEEESPVYIYETKSSFQKESKDCRYIEPKFVPFRFKKIGPHMSTQNLGKVKRLSPIFDIVFQADDILIERIKEFYEKN